MMDEPIPKKKTMKAVAKSMKEFFDILQSETSSDVLQEVNRRVYELMLVCAVGAVSKMTWKS